MIRKFILTLAVFASLCVAVFAVGILSNSTVAVPRAIQADSACPVAGCASGECHDYSQVPVPDGTFELSCPETGCASSDCHAWESLFSAYRTPSDASLNVWILAPAVLLLGLWALLKKA